MKQPFQSPQIILTNLSGGGGVNPYRLKAMFNDYLVCRSWDGLGDGPTDIYIAKPYKLRNSITQETIAGTTYTYTYGAGPDSLNRIRTTRIGSTVIENCLVTPEWLLNDLIYGIGAVTLVAGAPTVLMLNDGRAWAVEAT